MFRVSNLKLIRPDPSGLAPHCPVLHLSASGTTHDRLHRPNWLALMASPGNLHGVAARVLLGLVGTSSFRCTPLEDEAWHTKHGKTYKKQTLVERETGLAQSVQTRWQDQEIYSHAHRLTITKALWQDCFWFHTLSTRMHCEL